MFNLSKKIFKKMDFLLLTSVIILVIFGLFVLKSAVNPINLSLKSQFFATFVGFLGMIFILLLDLDFIKKIKWILYISSIGITLVTMVFGYGGESWGANLWLRIGSFTLQPSEISKVLHIVFLSAFIGENKDKVNSLKFILSYLILGYFPAALIIYQKDLGTALVFIFFTTAMFFISGISWKNIGKIIATFMICAIIAMPFVWSNLDGYIKERFIDFQDDNRNLASSTHQTDRGLIALGSGRLTGRGYMKGPFAQNSYIPEQHTDFIFPVLVEEFGFLGGTSLLMLYGLMFWRFYKIASNTDDLFHSSLTIGVFALLFIHIFENVGMTMKIMPVTGIPLPFMSNGGTFQMINLLLIGFTLSISMQRKSLDF